MKRRDRIKAALASTALARFPSVTAPGRPRETLQVAQDTMTLVCPMSPKTTAGTGNASSRWTTVTERPGRPGPGRVPLARSLVVDDNRVFPWMAPA